MIWGARWCGFYLGRLAVTVAGWRWSWWGQIIWVSMVTNHSYHLLQSQKNHHHQVGCRVRSTVVWSSWWEGECNGRILDSKILGGIAEKGEKSEKRGMWLCSFPSLIFSIKIPIVIIYHSTIQLKVSTPFLFFFFIFFFIFFFFYPKARTNHLTLLDVPCQEWSNKLNAETP